MTAVLLSNAAARTQARASTSQREAALKASAFRPAAPLAAKAARRAAAARPAALRPVAAAATVDAVRPTAVTTADKAQQKPTVIITGARSRAAPPPPPPPLGRRAPSCPLAALPARPAITLSAPRPAQAPPPAWA